jgi:SAM-dependent methyltransferase
MITSESLLHLVICSNCQTPLQHLSHCDHCGSVFGDEDGTPKLMAAQATRTVEFTFSAQRSQANANLLRRCFQYPPESGSQPRLPYHLDAAHATVIDQLRPQATVLEVGCGGAQMRTWLETKGHQYVGVDIAKTRVHAWLQEFGGPDVLCDAHFLPFRNQSFDLVYSVAVAEHLACPYLAIQEIWRVLKPGGKFVGTVSFMEPWHDNSFLHMSPLGVIELLTQAGFEITYVWPRQDYSGYEAIMAMGSSFTQPIAIAGRMLYGYYQLANGLRDVIKGLLQRRVRPRILDEAKIAGSIAWIATRPNVAEKLRSEFHEELQGCVLQ